MSLCFLDVDAQAKPPSGILNYDFTWLGSYDECVNLTSPGQDGFRAAYSVVNIVSNSTAPLTTAHTTQRTTQHNIRTTQSHTTTHEVTTSKQPPVTTSKQPPAAVTKTNVKFDADDDEVRSAAGKLSVSLGVCFPDHCSQKDITFIVDLVLQNLTQGSMFVKHDGVEKKIDRRDRELAGESIFAIVLITLVGMITLVSTMYELITTHVINNTYVSLTNEGDHPNGTLCNDSNVQIERDLAGEKPPAYKAKDVSRSKLLSLLLCFSAATNLSKLVSMTSSQRGKDSTGHLHCVNGIRVLSMAWVILGHTFSTSLSLLDNFAVIPDLEKNFLMQFIVNGTFSVDTFFVLSGLLLAYLTLKEMDKKNGSMNWPMFIFHRFWRLTPAYMVALIVQTTLWRYWGSGPLWPYKNFDSCHETWWTNALYINNFLHLDKQCFGHAWYLACDMQMFLITPIILIALYKNRKVGYLIIAVLAAGCIASGVLITFYYNLPIESSLNAPGPKGAESFTKLYVKPYVRLNPYIIGVLVGFLLYRHNGRVNLGGKVTVGLGWFTAFLLFFVPLYGLFPMYKGWWDYTAGVEAVYNGVARTCWGLSMGWLVLACVSGRGGLLNEFLSMPVWQPLSRLTYCAYLYHPMIVITYYLNKRHTIHLNLFEMVTVYFSLLFVAYLAAAVSSLMFESPMIALEKIVFKRGSATTRRHK